MKKTIVMLKRLSGMVTQDLTLFYLYDEKGICDNAC